MINSSPYKSTTVEEITQTNSTKPKAQVSPPNEELTKPKPSNATDKQTNPSTQSCIECFCAADRQMKKGKSVTSLVCFQVYAQVSHGCLPQMIGASAQVEFFNPGDLIRSPAGADPPVFVLHGSSRQTEFGVGRQYQ